MPEKVHDGELRWFRTDIADGAAGFIVRACCSKKALEKALVEVDRILPGLGIDPEDITHEVHPLSDEDKTPAMDDMAIWPEGRAVSLVAFDNSSLARD